jgi:hypothetical protein
MTLGTRAARELRARLLHRPRGKTPARHRLRPYRWMQEVRNGYLAGHLFEKNDVIPLECPLRSLQGGQHAYDAASADKR